MGRLKAVRSRLVAAKPRLSPTTDSEGHSPSTEPWRKWYGTPRWKALRWSVLLRDHFTCQCGCNRLVPDTPQLVADHRRPHRGDPARFWDPDNLQTLWKPHHDGWKQRLERAGRLTPRG